MLKLIGSGIRLVVFTVIVLLLGSWVQWGGRSLSDHVIGTFAQLRKAAETPISATLSGHNPVSAMAKEARQLHTEAKRRISEKAQAAHEDLLSVTERMRMRSLIKEVETH